MSPRGDSKPAKYGRGVWLALFIGLGVAFGLIIDNLTIGIACGVAIGIAAEMARASQARGESTETLTDGSREAKP